jgi:hypothetical protein
MIVGVHTVREKEHYCTVAPRLSCETAILLREREFPLIAVARSTEARKTPGGFLGSIEGPTSCFYLS